MVLRRVTSTIVLLVLMLAWETTPGRSDLIPRIVQAGDVGVRQGLQLMTALAAMPAERPKVWALGILAFSAETPYTAAQRAAISAALDRIAIAHSAEAFAPRFRAVPAYGFLYGQGSPADVAARAASASLANSPSLVVYRAADDSAIATVIISQLIAAGVSASAQDVSNFGEVVGLLQSGGAKGYVASFSGNEVADPILLLGHLAKDLLPKLKANTQQTDQLGLLLTDRVFWAIASPEDLEKQAIPLNNTLLEKAQIIPLFWQVPR